MINEGDPCGEGTIDGTDFPGFLNMMARMMDENPERLLCLTFNVWFDKRNQQERADWLCEELADSGADIICLQEVTPTFLSWLREKDFCQANYIISDSIGTTLKGSFAYGVIMLVRRRDDLQLHDFVLHSMPTQMNRSALVASLTFRGALLRVATAHLESLDNVAFRVAQLKVITRTLSQPTTDALLEALKLPEGGAADAAAAAAAAAGNGEERVHDCLLLGDMNFNDDATEETSTILTEARRTWQDCWVQLKGEGSLSDPEVGATMPVDDYFGKPTRIDRVFHSRGVLRPRRMERIGMDGIGIMVDGSDALAAEIPPDAPPPPPAGQIEERPSDHYGLVCEFEIGFVG